MNSKSFFRVSGLVAVSLAILAFGLAVAGGDSWGAGRARESVLATGLESVQVAPGEAIQPAGRLVAPVAVGATGLDREALGGKLGKGSRVGFGVATGVASGEPGSVAAGAPAIGEAWEAAWAGPAVPGEEGQKWLPGEPILVALAGKGSGSQGSAQAVEDGKGNYEKEGRLVRASLFEDRDRVVRLGMRLGGKITQDGLWPGDEDLFKPFGDEGAPLRIVEGPEGAYAFWAGKRDIQVVTGLAKGQWLDYLEGGGKLSLSWHKSLIPMVRSNYSGLTIFNDIQTLNYLDMTTWEDTEEAKAKGDGGSLTVFSAKPFSMACRAQRMVDDLSLFVYFNRPMVEEGEIGKAVPESDWPVAVSPGGVVTAGRWTGRRMFVMATQGLSDKEYQEKVIGVAFDITPNPGAKALTGEKLPQGGQKGRILDPFKLLGFQEAGFDDNGQALFDLFFNKAITRDGLGKAMSVMVVSGGEGEIETPVAELGIESVGQLSPLTLGEGLGEPGEAQGQKGAPERGLEARLRARARHGDALRLRIKNLVSADGRGRIEADERKLIVSDNLSVESFKAGVETEYPFRAFFSARFSEGLKRDGLERLVSLNPPVPFELEIAGSQVKVFAPFGRKDPIEVRFQKGFPGEHSRLEEDLSFGVLLPNDRLPKLAFTGEGRYLSPKLPRLVRLAGREADLVRLQAWKAYEHNLVTLLNLEVIGLEDFDNMRLSQAFSKAVFDREASLGEAPGDSFERLVNLDDLLGPEAGQHGVYVLKATPLALEKDGRKYANRYEAKDYDYLNPSDDSGGLSSKSSLYLPLVVTDLGLTARVLNGSLSVWVLGLSEASPVSGAEVKVYDRAGQVLAQGQSGQDGLFAAQVAEGQATVVTAAKDGDLSYLVLGDSPYYPESHDNNVNERRKTLGASPGHRATASGWDSGDQFLGEGLEAFIVLPRDIYKPGETVMAKALVRDGRMLPPGKPFPVLSRLKDPSGRVISQYRSDLSPEGGAEVVSEIPFSGRTGEWALEVLVPESSSPLGQAMINVEDFIPPRLALTLFAPSKVVGASLDVSLEGQARYLFGAPGEGLDWEMSAMARSWSFWVPGHEGFLFGVDPALADFLREIGDQAGTLGEGGRLDYRLGLSGDPADMPPVIMVDFVWRVMEGGGRWDGQSASLLWYPRETVLGLKPPPSLAAGQESQFELAAVDSEGRPSSVGEVEVRVFRLDFGQYQIVRHGQIRSQGVTRQESVRDLSVAIKDGRGSFTLGPLESGTYEIVARGPSGETLRRRLNVGLTNNAQEQPQTPFGQDSALFLSLDKPEYLPGETAILELKAPFDGPAWVTMETESLLFSKVGQIENGLWKVEIPITDTIVQNANLTAQAVKPLQEGDRSNLALGSLSLPMGQGPRTLSLSVDASERLAPSSKATVKIRLADSQGKPVSGTVSLSLVDEGLLGLTGFPVPDPLAFFGRSRLSESLFYDVYRLLLPPEKAALPFLAPGGGDREGHPSRDSLLSPFRREQEMLSLFLATVAIPASGEALVTLDIPEHSGQARLTAVAESGDRFGSYSASVNVSRDLTVEPTIPLALAPGDSLLSTVRIFLAQESTGAAGPGYPGGGQGNAQAIQEPLMGPAGTPKEILVTLETNGPLSLTRITDEEGNDLGNPFSPALNQGEAMTVKAHLVASPSAGTTLSPPGAPAAGPASLRLLVSHGEESFTQTANTVVRPPFPSVSVSAGGQLTAQETTIAVDYGHFLPGTAQASFSLGAGPAVEAARAAVFLQAYPYGCLEQTVSKAFAHVAALDLGAFVGDDSAVEARLALDSAIKRIATMRTFQGGFGSWPGSNTSWGWGTAYAAHFLVEASRHVETPPGLLEDALAYLKSLQSRRLQDQSQRQAINDRAYALFVLALHGESHQASVNYLLERQEGLSNAGHIYLAAAVALTEGRPQALQELEKKANYLETLPDDYYLESVSSNQALLLYAWAQVDPLNPRASELAAQVAAQGRQGIWRSTQENGLAILALSSLARRTGGSQPYQATISDSQGASLAKGGELDTLALGPKAMASLPGNSLTVSLSGQGRPWQNLTVHGVPTEPPSPRQNAITLSKTWKLPGSAPLPVSLPPGPNGNGAQALSVQRGQLVEVELTVAASKATESVVVADLFPGGFEIVGPISLKATGPGEDSEYDYEYEYEDDDYDYDPSREDYGYGDGARQGNSETHLEAREDRAIAVLPHLKSPTTLSYSLRAVTPGDYVFPPATAEGMYQPERQAVLATSRVTVTEPPKATRPSPEGSSQAFQ
ncbi:MAG: hypothetical protein LBU69_01245 [Deltaproteobacteria bacterium]|nr:hypothetical protein [Deltaproteobacteria bacterium]